MNELNNLQREAYRGRLSVVFRLNNTRAHNSTRSTRRGTPWREHLDDDDPRKRHVSTPKVGALVAIVCTEARPRHLQSRAHRVEPLRVFAAQYIPGGRFSSGRGNVAAIVFAESERTNLRAAEKTRSIAFCLHFSGPTQIHMWRVTTALAFAACAAGFGYIDEEATLLIANTRASNVVRFSQRDGSFLEEFIDDALLDSPDKLLMHDGALYVSSGTSPANSGILKFDKDTGEYLETIASGGGLYRPYGFAFGDQGVYVSSFLSDQILVYGGDEVSVFAQGDGSAESLVQGPNDMTFGMDGRLYVTTQGSVAINGSATYPGYPSQVIVFDVTTGMGDVFIPQPEPSSFGFVSLLGIKQDLATGDFYVSDFANNIRVYDSDGALLRVLDTDISGKQWVGNLDFGADGYLFAVVFDFEDDAAPGAILRWDEQLQPAPLGENQASIFVDFHPELVRPIGILAV